MSAVAGFAMGVVLLGLWAHILAPAQSAALIVGYGLPWLEAWVTRAVVEGNTAARRLLCFGAGVGIVALALAVVLSGVNMIRIGRRVIGQGRFPPEGLRVLRDTRVVEGRIAIATGRLQATLGALLIACAAALLGLGGYVVVMLWPG